MKRDGMARVLVVDRTDGSRSTMSMARVPVVGEQIQWLSGCQREVTSVTLIAFHPADHWECDAEVEVREIFRTKVPK